MQIKKQQSLALAFSIIQLSAALLINTSSVSPAFCKSEKQSKNSEVENTKPMTLAERMKPVKEISTVDDLSRWMTYYYLHPQPDLVVSAIQLADQNNLLEGDSIAPFQGFLSRVFESNPEQIPTWFGQLGNIKDSSKTVVLTAVWWSNTKEGKTLLDNIANSLPDKSKIEFHKQIDKKAEDLDKLAIESPDVLDILWGAFSATGDEKYVRRLMTPLSWGEKDVKDLDRLMISSAASWSLASNLDQHPKVKEICQKACSESGSNLKPYLEKVFADAQKAQLEAKAKAKKSSLTAENGNRN